MGTLDGIKVLDMSTLLAGPTCATMLGDHGADVIKVEHPKGDDIRNWGDSVEGIPLWWKVISRNKKLIAVDLHDQRGRDIVKKLIMGTDILIENFRPGKLEKWGLGYDVLIELNPKLIILRVTGFGQTGPYSSFPGFGTLAEAMSGFANVTGEAYRPPTLPSFGLADGIAGIAGAFAAIAAIYKRDKTGMGEVIDLSLYDPLMWIVGAQIVEYDKTGKIQNRQGNRSTRTCPRNTYRTIDDKWVAISASADSIAYRLFNIMGMPELSIKYPTNRERVKHVEEIDTLVQDWIGKKTQDEVVELLRDSEVAIAPIYDAAQIYKDEHYRQRGSIVTLSDDDFGNITMQGIFPKFEKNPGKIKHPGKNSIGHDTDSILHSIGIDKDVINHLRKDGVIR